MKKGSKILISGAGIAGLTAALRLAKAGMNPVVVEKAELPRLGGFLVALSHQAYFFAEEMGLIPALKPYDLRITSSGYYNRSGRALLELDYSRLFTGLGIIQVSRDDLARVLYEQTKDIADIRFGESIKNLHNGPDHVDVSFHSGKTESFDVVIGADGLHSAVRELVFRPESYKRHYLDLYVAAFKLPNILNLEARFETHMERSRYMAVHNTAGTDIGAVFVWDAPGARSLPPLTERCDFLLSAFADTSPITRQVLEYCPKDAPFYMDALSQVDIPAWHKGRCVLVGDSAWCLTLFSGRGAAAAFAGACRLADALIAHEPEEAFNIFEAQTRPIIDDIMPATRKAVRWYVPRTMINHTVRDGLMRFVPNGVFRQYFKLKYSKV